MLANSAFGVAGFSLARGFGRGMYRDGIASSDELAFNVSPDMYA